MTYFTFTPSRANNDFGELHANGRAIMVFNAENWRMIRDLLVETFPREPPPESNWSSRSLAAERRERIATACATGLRSSSEGYHRDSELIARWAVSDADALIAALDKP